jgi:hypothetical protein
MEALVESFAGIFTTPCSLPPPRRKDHRIFLLPGTTPVAVRPYRYPQLLKDEVQRQYGEMLHQVIIHESASVFSSPVLVVKKADNTWHFLHRLTGAQPTHGEGQISNTGG